MISIFKHFLNLFFNGFVEVFNIFPETDYMAFVPKEGRLEQESYDEINNAYIDIIDDFGNER